MPPPAAGAEGQGAADRLPRHALFGHVLASDFRFEARLGAARGEPDLVFATEPDPLDRAAWSRLEPLYRSEQRSPEGRAVLDLYEGGRRQVLRCGGIVDFYLGPARIGYDLLDPSHGYLVEIRLLGPVLAYWLERRGLPALHAAAVEIGGGAVAFLSGNRSGKTTLAATFLCRGHRLLSDDVLPIAEREGSPAALPGYPQMRMWPATRRRFAAHLPSLARVHPRHDKVRVPVGEEGFGEFCGEPLPLRRIYLPRRAGAGEETGGVEIEALAPADALVELVRGSFTPHLVEAAGLQPARLEGLARLAERVPARRLVYPSGFDRLEEIADAMLRDLDG